MTATGSIEASDGIELFTRSWAPDDPKRDMLMVHGLGEH